MTFSAIARRHAFSAPFIPVLRRAMSTSLGTEKKIAEIGNNIPILEAEIGRLKLENELLEQKLKNKRLSGGYDSSSANQMSTGFAEGMMVIGGVVIMGILMFPFLYSEYTTIKRHSSQLGGGIRY